MYYYYGSHVDCKMSDERQMLAAICIHEQQRNKLGRDKLLTFVNCQHDIGPHIVTDA